MLKVSVIVIGVFLVGSARAAPLDCNIDECRQPMKIYEELGCKPIYGSKSCCPKRFECADDLKVIKDEDRCTFRGVDFQIGDVLPRKFTNESKCLEACVCSRYEDEAAKFMCSNSDCGISSFKVPGCINIFGDVNECCSTSIVCDDEEKEQLATCWDGNVEYREGEKFISKSNPCYECLCHKDFDNATIAETAHCRKLNCEIELKYKSEIQRGCLPIFENDKCCPVDWKCFDYPKKIQKRSAEETPEVAVITPSQVIFDEEEDDSEETTVAATVASTTEEVTEASTTEAEKAETSTEASTTEAQKDELLTEKSTTEVESLSEPSPDDVLSAELTTEASTTEVKKDESTTDASVKETTEAVKEITDEAEEEKIEAEEEKEETTAKVDEIKSTAKSENEEVKEATTSAVTTESVTESQSTEAQTTPAASTESNNDESEKEKKSGEEEEATTAAETTTTTEESTTVEKIETTTVQQESDAPPPPAATDISMVVTTLKEYVANLDLSEIKSAEDAPPASFVNYTISRSLAVAKEEEAKSIVKRSLDLSPQYVKHSSKDKGCSFGLRQYKVGEEITTDNECLECFCNYAPIGHCVKKENCSI